MRRSIIIIQRHQNKIYMQIKVKDTRMHKTIKNCKYCNSTGKYEVRYDKIIDCQHCKNQLYEIPVAEGKLLLILQQGSIRDGSKILISDDKGNEYQPIIVSETEKIEQEDLYFNERLGLIGVARVIPSDIDRCKKILALPEHFSIKHLKAIEDGKMKDGGKVLVECNAVPNEIDNPLTNPDGLIHFPGAEFEIKFNPFNHIILHKAAEEKMYTSTEVKDLICAAFDANITDYDGVLIEDEFEKWFEQNVK
jgi:hypothetical protein